MSLRGEKATLRTLTAVLGVESAGSLILASKVDWETGDFYLRGESARLDEILPRGLATLSP